MCESARQGVAVVRDDGRAIEHEATQYTFIAAPYPCRDGRGLIGIVSKRGSRTALAYTPIAVPLADVVNAWRRRQRVRRATVCEKCRTASRAGKYRPAGYSLYERYGYSTDFPPPFLVTTDLVWENFAAAFNGVFILLERRRATPAYQSFVVAANEALGRASPGSRWAKAFAALAGFVRGDTTGKPAASRTGTPWRYPPSSTQHSTSGDSSRAATMPRAPEMARYFRRVHYLTELSRSMDPAPLLRPFP